MVWLISQLLFDNSFHYIIKHFDSYNKIDEDSFLVNDHMLTLLMFLLFASIPTSPLLLW